MQFRIISAISLVIFSNPGAVVMAAPPRSSSRVLMGFCSSRRKPTYTHCPLVRLESGTGVVCSRLHSENYQRNEWDAVDVLFPSDDQRTTGGFPSEILKKKNILAIKEGARTVHWTLISKRTCFRIQRAFYAIVPNGDRTYC